MTTTQQDKYSSRVAPTPYVYDRLDPVVYTEKKGPLSEKEFTHFKEKGYLFFESFFSGQELETLIEAQKRLKQDYTHKIEKNHAAKGASSSFEEVIFELENKKAEVRSIFNIHHSDPFFSLFSKHPRIVRIIEHLLQSQVYIHQSRINYKPPFRGKEFYWHSDFETWHVEDGMPHMRAISCSILLTENTTFNGPLMVIPESHKTFISCVGETPDNHYQSSLRKQEYGIPDDNSLAQLTKKHGIQAPLGKPGSILLFDCNLMHGSNSNISPDPRTNLFFVYNSIHNALVDPFGGTVPRPDYIANRTVSPIEL